MDEIRELLCECSALTDAQAKGLEIYIREDNVVFISGKLETVEQKVAAGHAVVKAEWVRNVVNNISVPGEKPFAIDPDEVSACRNMGTVAEGDVVIIGGGISGCAIARELSRYEIKVILVEAGSDVCEGASKANSGAIHPGHLVKPGTLKAKLNVEGNKMYTEWAEELGFRFIRNGQLTLAYDEASKEKVIHAYETALKNGVPGVELISVERAKEMEPALEGEPIAILYTPTMGVVEPYEVVIALANNAARNGVKFLLDSRVVGIDHNDSEGYLVITKQGCIKTKYIVDAAGIHADDIADMVGDKFYSLHPRRGTIVLYDKAKIRDYPFTHRISYLPVKDVADSKGGGFSPTPEGNMNAGPSATECLDKDDLGTTQQDLDFALARSNNCPGLVEKKDVIAFFTGIRACDYKEDFIIEMSDKAHGFLHVSGIQSPGLASAPAVAKMAVSLLTNTMISDGYVINRNKDFEPCEPHKTPFRELSREEQEKLISKDPTYGRVVCRCETITEGEIIEAIRSPLMPITVDAIKRRTRAGMGRCQGGFCRQKVIDILAKELGVEKTEIRLKSDRSYILLQDTRENVAEEVSKK